MADEHVAKPKPDEPDKDQLKIDKEAVKDLEIREDESEQVKGGAVKSHFCDGP